MRVLCVISTMGPGGAERMMSRLVDHLADRHEVVLMTWEAAHVPSFYPLPQVVRVLRLDLLGGRGVHRLYRILARFLAIRRTVYSARPDVVLSFMDTTNIMAVFACLGSGVPVVAAERTDPSHQKIGQFKSVLRLLAYVLAKRVVVQTQRVRSVFPRWTQNRMEVIPNPAPLSVAMARPDRPRDNGRFRIIGLGRLGREKGFDRLIAAFAEAARNHPEWDLVIFGEGSERTALTEQIKKLQISDRVQLPGITTKVNAELAASHLMAFPSRYEGFPNALAEGISVGLPAVAFAGVSGVEELIVPEQTGLLVDPAEGPAGLAGALDRLMSDAVLRARFGAAARDHAVKWAPNVILDKWEAMLAGAATHTPARHQPASP